MAAARDDHDISDACCKEGLHRVIDHGFIVDRQQVFVCDFCERIEA
jgi:hypothetical protein